MSIRCVLSGLLSVVAIAGLLGCQSAELASRTDADLLRAATPLPRTHYGSRLEPSNNTVLIGAGQTDVQSFLDFSHAVAPAQPTVFMTYVDLRDDLPPWFQQLQLQLTQMPAVIPQIGLSLNRGQAADHYEAETARGDDDSRIDQFCDGLQRLDRPVYLRPGYEFNGPWNGYLPTAYVAAFRRIAARIHACAPQVALVWDWSADAELDAETGGSTAAASSRWRPFYPGDDAVDWWALNLFSTAGVRNAATEQFLRAAAVSQHPVMIAESTPQGYDLSDPVSAQAAWRDWFLPYFALVHRYSGIRAFCYINWNWAAYPQWSDWGDSRVQQAPAGMQQELRNELTRPLPAR